LNAIKAKIELYAAGVDVDVAEDEPCSPKSECSARAHVDADLRLPDCTTRRRGTQSLASNRPKPEVCGCGSGMTKFEVGDQRITFRASTGNQLIRRGHGATSHNLCRGGHGWGTCHGGEGSECAEAAHSSRVG
jgi:hypothetical protein